MQSRLCLALEQGIVSCIYRQNWTLLVPELRDLRHLAVNAVGDGAATRVGTESWDAKVSRRVCCHVLNFGLVFVRKAFNKVRKAVVLVDFTKFIFVNLELKFAFSVTHRLANLAELPCERQLVDYDYEHGQKKLAHFRLLCFLRHGFVSIS